jgi:hypothetical protein
MRGVGEMYCSLCQKYHGRPKLKPGWFARGYKQGKYKDMACRLICPDCFKSIMPTESGGAIFVNVSHTTGKNGLTKPQPVRRLFN